MKAHIKIDEKIDKCRDCPFFYDMAICNVTGRSIYDDEDGDFDTIPSWCPFLVKEEKEEDDE